MGAWRRARSTPVKSFSKVGRKAQIGRKTVYEIDPWSFPENLGIIIKHFLWLSTKSPNIFLQCTLNDSKEPFSQLKGICPLIIESLFEIWFNQTLAKFVVKNWKKLFEGKWKSDWSWLESTQMSIEKLDCTFVINDWIWHGPIFDMSLSYIAKLYLGLPIKYGILCK